MRNSPAAVASTKGSGDCEPRYGRDRMVGFLPLLFHPAASAKSSEDGFLIRFGWGMADRLLAGIALDNSAHVPIQSTCNVTTGRKI